MQGVDYRFGCKFGAFSVGVRVVDGEEECGFFGAKGFETVGFDGGHVDDGDLFGCGDLVFVVAESHVALDAEVAVGVVYPDVADSDGEQDRSSLFRARVGDVFADVPAVSVDGLRRLASEGAGGEGFRERELDGFVADAFDAVAGLGVGGWIAAAAVVVTHLDEDVVAGLHLGEHVGPMAFVVITAGAAAGNRTIGDVDLRGVEVVGEVVAPAEVGLIAAVESPTMKSVGRAGLSGAFCATLVWGGASGVAGT